MAKGAKNRSMLEAVVREFPDSPYARLAPVELAELSASRAPASFSPIPTQPGATKVNSEDGLKYIWIPPGRFLMGCSPGDSEWRDDEKPALSENLAAPRVLLGFDERRFLGRRPGMLLDRTGANPDTRFTKDIRLPRNARAESWTALAKRFCSLPLGLRARSRQRRAVRCLDHGRKPPETRKSPATFIK